MKPLVFAVSLCFATCLSADKITTPEGNSFEGVVTIFDKDKTLTLSTGYGDLVFVVKTEVEVASASEYSWPKTSPVKKPARAPAFSKWAEEAARERAKAEEAARVTWRKITQRQETGEGKIQELMRVTLDELQARSDPDRSVREREAAFEAVKQQSGKWFYACFAVDRIVQTGDDVEVHFMLTPTRPEYEGDVRWRPDAYVVHDPRTGSATDYYFTSLSPLRAKKGCNGADVDKLNEDEDARHRFVDFDEASKWKRGSGVVVRLELVVLEDEWHWALRPARVQPLVAPKIQRR